MSAATPTPAKAPAKVAAELPPAAAAQACLRTAEELEKKGFDEDAIGHYERARHLDPKLPDISPRLAALYARCGDDRGALAEFEKARKLSPNDPDLLNDLGYFHTGRGDFAAAERCLREVVRLKPDYVRGWTNLGVVCAKTGRTDESRKAFARAMTPAQAEYNLGVLLAGQGRTDEGRACLRAAAALDPQFQQAADALKRLDTPAADKTTAAVAELGR